LKHQPRHCEQSEAIQVLSFAFCDRPGWDCFVPRNDDRDGAIQDKDIPL